MFEGIKKWANKIPRRTKVLWSQNTPSTVVLFAVGSLFRLLGLGSRIGSIFLLEKATTDISDANAVKDDHEITKYIIAYGGSWIGGQLFDHAGNLFIEPALIALSTNISKNALKHEYKDRSLKFHEEKSLGYRYRLVLEAAYFDTHEYTIGVIDLTMRYIELGVITGLVGYTVGPVDTIVGGSVGAISIFTIVNILLNNWVQSVEVERLKYRESFFNKTVEVLENYVVIHSYDSYASHQVQFEAAQQEYNARAKKLKYTDQAANSIRDLLTGVSLTMITLISGRSALDPSNEFTSEDFTIIVFFFLLWLTPFRDLPVLLRKIAIAEPGLDQTIELFYDENTAEIIEENVEAKVEPVNHAVVNAALREGLINNDAEIDNDLFESLEFNNVSLSFNVADDAKVEINKKILNNVNFIVKPGEVVAIIGESGSGKSTITKLILGFYKPDPGGEVLLNRASVSDQRVARKVRKISAFIPQEITLFGTSNLEFNIQYSSKHNANSLEFKNAIKTAKIDDLWAERKDQAVINPKKVSGGQKQRIGIARAILKEPRLFIIDEATSGLDGKTEAEVVTSFNEILSKNQDNYPNKQKPSMIVITHRLDTIKQVTRILYLSNEGKLIEKPTKGFEDDEDIKKFICNNSFYAGDVNKVNGLVEEQEIKQGIDERNNSSNSKDSLESNDINIAKTNINDNIQPSRSLGL